MDEDKQGAATDGSAPSSPVPWPPVVLVGCLLAAVVLDAALRLPWPAGGLATLLAWAGGALVVAAVAVDVWAIATLSRHRTTVLPHRTSEQLVTSGPFARSRNPIYLANAALLVGIGLFAGNAWFLPAAAALVALTTRLAIEPEERHLAARFGPAYEAYRAKAPRWL